jgi:hypothetical protein
VTGWSLRRDARHPRSISGELRAKSKHVLYRRKRPRRRIVFTEKTQIIIIWLCVFQKKFGEWRMSGMDLLL